MSVLHEDKFDQKALKTLGRKIKDEHLSSTISLSLHIVKQIG